MKLTRRLVTCSNTSCNACTRLRGFPPHLPLPCDRYLQRTCWSSPRPSTCRIKISNALLPSSSPPRAGGWNRSARRYAQVRAARLGKALGAAPNAPRHTAVASLQGAADVVDDSIVASSQRTALAQDALVIPVDARPEPARSPNDTLDSAVTSRHLAQLAVELITLEPEQPAPILGFLEEVRAALPNATRRTRAGYAAERAVPAQMLNQRQGRDWEVVRVGIDANDFDEGERGCQSLHWQPDRFGESPVAGTGTLVRR